jgi:hypothetical protein
MIIKFFILSLYKSDLIVQFQVALVILITGINILKLNIEIIDNFCGIMKLAKIN